MIKRLTIALGLALAVCGVSQAQVQNYALRLNAGSSVDCGMMPQLDNAGDYTVQFWMNPDEWTRGAVILDRGEGFKVSLGNAGELEFQLGATTLKANSTKLKAGAWAQVTLLSTGTGAKALINGEESGSATGNTNIAASESPLTIGGGYKGRIDEIRIWKCVLESDFEYYIHNTLNEWMPQYEDLLVYYKMDQELCEHLVDYCAIDKEADYNNHGILKDGATKEAVTDNEGLPYIINSAYTANERFYDRYIPAEQYRLSNDIIILGVMSYADGHLELSSANDHATLCGDAKRLAEYEGRNAVLSIDGNGWLEAPSSAMDNTGGYGFESFIYLEEWTDGAYLVRRENVEGTEGFAVMLDHFSSDRVPDPVAVIKIRVNGKCWNYPVNITTGEWHHIGVGYRGGNTVNTVFNVGIDGESAGTPRAYYHDGSTDGVPAWPADAKVEIGKGLKACLDQTVIPRSGAGAGDFASHMKNGLPMVSLTQQVTSTILQNAGAYYDYDDPEQPGFDLYSQDNWLRIMKSAFDGYRGAHFYLSVKTPKGYNDSNLNTLISNASWREKFATDLAELSKPYDGVELDLEWVYNWNAYGLLAQKIREKLPEGKIYRVSTHNVTYSFPKDKMQYVDGFTFQQYGPQTKHFVYSTFESYCRAFVSYGYDRKKIMTSYSTTTSNGSIGSPIKGVKDGFFDGDYEPQLESEYKDFNGERFYFTGPLQTYHRAKYTREQGFMGIFYWDMGNDVYDTNPDGTKTMSKWNLARWSTYAINSNIDRLVTKVDVNHYGSAGIYTPIAEGDAALTAVCDGDVLRLCMPGKAIESVAIYSADGAMVFNGAVRDGAANIPNVGAGVYLLTAKASDNTTYKAKFIKK